ncbi:hypothetical protein [Candidatus Enterovibrio escicola]|uniref:hypothetical protein n=1 Tax=Candidatus Enterovibrio escicola TaxID=1927127 RepID=UPI001237B8C6|nr:hypothetical protein [Candidatus Enterovibrio escacola]
MLSPNALTLRTYLLLILFSTGFLINTPASLGIFLSMQSDLTGKLGRSSGINSPFQPSRSGRSHLPRKIYTGRALPTRNTGARLKSSVISVLRRVMLY